MPISVPRSAAHDDAANDRAAGNGPGHTPLAMRSIEVDGQPLRVAVRPGTAAGVPLLLVNGIGASLELLQPFVDAIDPAVDVIRFGVPGVGGSPLPARPYRFTGLCRLMARLLSTVGYGGADVLGISWGGAVAQHFAVVQRARCRRLVLASTATGALMVPARPSVLAHMVTPRRYRDPGYLQGVAGDLYGGSARTEPDRVSALMHAESRPGSGRGYLYQLAALTAWTSLPFLPLIRQPTLIVPGDDDPVIPLANARVLHSLISRSRLHVFHGGHLGLVTEAAELVLVIGRFLAGHTGSGRAG
jgi:poly(3-hydroxyalkanoate) depolymerase